MINVLIVDDSPTARSALRLALEGDSQIVVVGEANDGKGALRLSRHLKPDLVTMDVFLRNEDGLDVVAQLMATNPLPVLVVTGANLESSELSFEAIEAGALDVIPKLPSPNHPSYEAGRNHLVRLVRALSKVPVVHHFRSKRLKSRRPAPSSLPAPPPSSALSVLCMGASTGGPLVVCSLLQKLPAPFPVPIVFTQHISPGFTKGLATWLSQTTGHEVVLVENTCTLVGGVVYLPKDDHHLKFLSYQKVASVKEVRGTNLRPSIDVLFNSACKHLGNKSIGVLFTGMGSDGAEGLAALRREGACTIVQSPETCTIDSMPQSAIDLGAAAHVLAPEAIAELLCRKIL